MDCDPTSGINDTGSEVLTSSLYT